MSASRSNSPEPRRRSSQTPRRPQSTQPARTTKRKSSRTAASSAQYAKSSRGVSDRNPKAAPVKKRKRRNRRPGPLAWLIGLLVILATGFMIFELIRLDVLPVLLLIVIMIVLILMALGLVYVWLVKTRRPVTKAVTGALVVVLGLVMGVGGYYVRATEAMFGDITTLTDKKANIMTTYAMKPSGITEIKQLKDGAKVGVSTGLDPEGYEAAIAQLKSKGADIELAEYEDEFSLVDGLYHRQVDAIIFPENYHVSIYEMANDDNQYNALTTYTNKLDEYTYYTERDPDSINKSDPVGNIRRDPFAVLISGNDSYGSIDTAGRSDVNMLVIVNPKTAQILMISVPRDSYVPVSCSKAPTACEGIEGLRDKLTHTGLYGIGTTESTLEDMLDVKINYYVRVNFSSLVNLVDAVGGIDVDVPEGQEVETFYANGEKGVHAGKNHLEGERALAFARERHAYLNGDNQRVINQQMVMRALIQKCMSPSMFVHYPNVVKAVSTAIDTNMSAHELKSLIALEISKRPAWNIQSYAISGEPSDQYCPSLGASASVTVPIPSTVAYAKQLIKDAEDGQTISVDPEGNYEYAELDAGMYDFNDAYSTNGGYGNSGSYGSSNESGIYDPYGTQGQYGSDSTLVDPYTGLPVEQTPEYDIYGNPVNEQTDPLQWY